MTLCIQLVKKDRKTPSRMSMVDADICRHFNAEVNSKFYHEGWYDIIGYLLATGRTFEEVRARLVELEFSQRLIDICDFLSENYIAQAWWETKPYTE